MTGTIKKIVEGKPFGFISVEGMEKDLFFHENSLADGKKLQDFHEGDAVSFDTKDSPKGMSAENVKHV